MNYTLSKLFFKVECFSFLAFSILNKLITLYMSDLNMMRYLSKHAQTHRGNTYIKLVVDMLLFYLNKVLHCDLSL